MWGRLAGVALLVALTQSGCREDLWRGMWYQPSVGPEADPRSEPEHSVPLGAEAPITDRDEATDLPNPVVADAVSLARGKALFLERCVCCHGPTGHGGGPVSKFFPPAPDLSYATVLARSDGFIYATIAIGGRAMPPQGEGLTPHDRWDLVNHVREVQRLPAPQGHK